MRSLSTHEVFTLRNHGSASFCPAAQPAALMTPLIRSPATGPGPATASSSKNTQRSPLRLLVLLDRRLPLTSAAPPTSAAPSRPSSPPPSTGKSCQRTPILGTTTCSPRPPPSTACRSTSPRLAPSPTWLPAGLLSPKASRQGSGTCSSGVTRSAEVGVCVQVRQAVVVAGLGFCP